MRDGLGAVQSVLLIGGTSDIGVAIVRRLSEEHRLKRVILAARDIDNAQLRANSLEHEMPGCSVSVVHFDASQDALARDAIESAFADGPIDCVINAAGLLGTNTDPIHDLDGVNAMLQANYVSAILTGTQVVERFKKQGYGSLVLLSSVAAERARGDNFVYASTKAGLDAWGCGLADALADEPIDVIVVRPGFVHSRMTEGLNPQPLSTTPEQVAVVVVDAIQKRTPLVWAPKTVRPLMSALRHLPRPVFRVVSKRASS